MFSLQKPRTLGEALSIMSHQEAKEDLTGKNAKNPEIEPISEREAYRSFRDPTSLRTDPK